MNIVREDIRNIAIIAHVDHGKTTLVDEMLKQGGVFRSNQQVADRVMDSNDLERERGITILSKNTAVHYNGVKINIVDTPGHADFSGEVERVLKMVSGVLLLVDSFEGPMPQTRFVLKKALELNLKVIIVINKMDRPDARCEEVVDETLELLMELDATDEQLDSPILFASGRTGTATDDWKNPGKDLRPLFDCILSHIPAPEGDPDAPLQLLISTIDYNDYVGRIGVGRIERGTIQAGQTAIRCVHGSSFVSAPARLAGLYTFDGLKRVNAESASVGDIVAISGFPDLLIGDTVCNPAMADPLPFVKIDEPTISMTFCVNDSPVAGTEGQFVTSRHLRARLEREALTDVSLRVEETDSTDAFRVYGRGELHLSILIETMRRQGYEFAVTKPEVLYKTIDGQKCEPMERLVCDVPTEYAGSVIDKFPKEPFEVAKLNPRAAEAAGLPELPVKLGRGNAHYGIEHLWRNHKELFADPDAAIRLLKETLGNQNCRVVISLKRAVDKSYGQRKVICLKRIVLHNPQTQAYCVLVWDGKELKLVSWNNAGDDYGDSEWTLK